MNFGDHPHAIHGIGWRRPWRVEAVGADSITLSLRHKSDPRARPFAFTAMLTYRLSRDGLTVAIAATNGHGEPTPMGIGAHPYFPASPTPEITFQADGVWETRVSLPSHHIKLPLPRDQTAGLDHCFTGWRGQASWPGMRITADPVFADLQVYTPAYADFFRVEPVSHAPNAPNTPDAAAMTLLAPGETLRGAITLTPRAGLPD